MTLHRTLLRLPRMAQRAFADALAHDAVHLSRSASYSAIIALFPALILLAAAVALLPDAQPIREQVGGFFDRVLPDTVFPLLTSYFSSSPSSPHTARALLLAAIVSFTGASSTLSSILEGLHRAMGVADDAWTRWERRWRTFALVPLALFPMVLATVLVVFGQVITDLLTRYTASELRPAVLGAALLLRWTVALAGVVALTAIIYHLGTPALQRRHWRHTLPGAIAATVMWFATTLLFGWYVTRFANYSQVYGPLGAGIALLLWLYIVFLSVLVGGEFNAQWMEHSRRQEVLRRPLVRAPAAPAAAGAEPISTQPHGSVHPAG